jgi:hypothetical protein
MSKVGEGECVSDEWRMTRPVNLFRVLPERGRLDVLAPLDPKPEGDGIFWIAVAKIPKVS